MMSSAATDGGYPPEDWALLIARPLLEFGTGHVVSNDYHHRVPHVVLLIPKKIPARL